MANWSELDDFLLKRMYPDRSNRDIAAALGKSKGAVENRAKRLGLKKSRRYLLKKPGCFKPEHKPWNMGISTHAGGRSAETRFKPGGMPWTHVPIGTETVDRDGYRKRKVRDDAPKGQSRKNWRFVHVIEWEKHHGPLPPGHIVRFVDGDKTNISRENLVAISHAENAVINRMMGAKDIPELGLHSLILMARIKIKASKLAKRS